MSKNLHCSEIKKTGPYFLVFPTTVQETKQNKTQQPQNE
jgi:hypothetical protein